MSFSDDAKAAFAKIAAVLKEIEASFTSCISDAAKDVEPIAEAVVEAGEIAAKAALTQVAGSIAQDATKSVTDEIAAVAGTVIGVAAKTVL